MNRRERELVSLVERYVDFCRQEERMPNRAGFLRFSNITMRKYKSLCEGSRDIQDIISAIFEDEALNSGGKKIPAATLNMYLKSRFGYGEKEEEEAELISNHDAEDFD